MAKLPVSFDLDGLIVIGQQFSLDGLLLYTQCRKFPVRQHNIAYTGGNALCQGRRLLVVHRIQKIHAVLGTVRKVCIVQRKFLLQRSHDSDAPVFHAVTFISIPLLKIAGRKHRAKVSLICYNHILVLRLHDIHNQKLRFRHGIFHIEQIQNLTVDVIPVFP